MFQTEELIESVEKTICVSDDIAYDLILLGRQLSTSRLDPFSFDPFGVEQPSVIRCQRALDSGKWKVTVRDCIGAIQVPGLLLLVLPKIPLSHFCHIASHAFLDTRLVNEVIDVSSGDTFQDIVATWFVSATEKLLSLGMAKGLVEIEEDVRSVQGQLNIRKSLSNWISGKTYLHSKYETLDEDTPDNRVLKQAASLVAHNKVFPTLLRSRAARVLEMFKRVGPMRIQDLESRPSTTLNTYKKALSLALAVIQGSGFHLRTGNQKFYCFLLRTPLLVEQGLRLMLSNTFHDIGRFKPATTSIELRSSGLTMNPDLFFRFRPREELTSTAASAARPVVVGDVKYVLSDGSWKRPDLYQIVTFSTALHCVGGFVLTFGVVLQDCLQDLRIGDLRIGQFTWPTDGSLSPQMAQESVTKALSEWLTQVEKDLGQIGSQGVNQMRLVK